MNTATFSMRMDVNIKKKLELEAKQAERPVSYLALEAIKEYLIKKENKRQAIKEAIKEANKGVFVSEESTDAWFYSLGTENELPMPEPDIFLNQK